MVGDVVLLKGMSFGFNDGEDASGVGVGCGVGVNQCAKHFGGG